MTKKLMIVICAGFLMLAGIQPAFSQDGDIQCKKIRGHGKVVDFQTPCLENPEFSFCIVQEVRGGLTGTWVSNQQDGWGDQDLAAAGLPVPPDSPITWYIREFEVFSTKHGTVYGDSQLALDARIFDSGGGAAIPTVITGGTGIYEGATGWIVAVSTDELIEEFTILGEICGPKIRYDDDLD